MNLKQAAETFSIVSCSTRDNSPRDLCIMTLYRYMDKVDNEGNNEEYFPPKFQDNTYFNFANNIGQKLPLVLTDSLSSFSVKKFSFFTQLMIATKSIGLHPSKERSD